jgi:hypothetical protein
MRQTSAAVLLLIASAQAAQVNPVWNKKVSAITPTLADQGKWLGFSGRPVYTQAADADRMTSTVGVKTDVADTKANITDGNSSCVQCVRGKTVGGTNKRTVWCSAGWNYEYTALKLDKAYPALSKAKSNTEPQAWNVLGDGDGATDLVKGDQGFCCYTLDQMI